MRVCQKESIIRRDARYVERDEVKNRGALEILPKQKKEVFLVWQMNVKNDIFGVPRRIFGWHMDWERLRISINSDAKVVRWYSLTAFDQIMIVGIE